jgi:uncharacterized membrane protein SpoIIM required for sporulation
MIIDLPRFIAMGRPAWSELERTLERLETHSGAPLTLDEARRFHHLYQRVSADLARIATFAGFLMVNNIKVSIFALALGMTYGVGTMVLLFFNGVVLGLIAIDYVLAGQLVFLLGWLMPHGVIEIPAILLAGQAGLILGKALIGWGDRLPLRARFRVIGADLMTLIGGVAVMLVWAGMVESFLSQYHQPVIPYWAKIAFGSVELVALVWFLARCGRAVKDAPVRAAS